MQTTKGATFIYAAASLAFTLIPPAIARLMVAGLMLTAIAMVWWTQQQEIVLLGLLADIGDTSADPVFAAVRPLGFGDPGLLWIPSDQLAAVVSPAVGDLVLAFGGQDPSAAATLGVDGVFVADTVYLMPTSMVFEAYAQLDLRGTIAETNDLGIVLMGILVVLFAGLALRVGIAVAFAPIALLAVWLLMTWNVESWAMAPVPMSMIIPLTWCAATVGAVLAFKSTLKDPSGLGLRIAALVLAAPLAVAMEMADLLPTPLNWVIVPAGLIWPVLVPTLAAALLIRDGLDLDLPTTLAVAAGLLLLRWPLLKRAGTAVGAAPTRPFTPEPDHTGAISLDSLLRSGKET